MKYIRKFDSHKAYTTAYTELKDLSCYVTMYEDKCNQLVDNIVPVNKVMFSHKTNTAWAGDLLCWDTVAKDWEIVHVNVSNDTLSLGDNLIPDAVCVVPACHTEDGKARWCALNDVYNESLAYDPSASHHLFKWAIGSYNDTTTPAGKLIDELPLYTAVPKPVYESDFSDCSNSEIGSWGSWGGYVAVELSPDANTHNDLNCRSRASSVLIGSWAQNTKDPVFDVSLRINSKYITSGCGFWTYEADSVTKNDIAFTFNNSDGDRNIFCDLNGFENTQILLKLSPTGTEYPAALAASLYEQDYSPAGTWYLPSAGELAYLLARWYTIQHTLYCLQQGSYDVSRLDCDCNYWSSTLYSAVPAVSMNTYDGSLHAYNKINYNYVRPFRSF